MTIISGTIEVKQGVSYWKPNEVPFENYEDAGRILGSQVLKDYSMEELKDAVVLGCPRDGVVLAKGVADAIKNAGGIPTLDLVICRKIPLPTNDDIGLGSVTEQGEAIYIDRLVKMYSVDITSEAVAKTTERVQKEVTRRIQAYREGKPPASIDGKVVIIVDGTVSGSTITACVKSVRAFGAAKRIIIATPLLSEKGRSTVIDLTGVSTENICTAVIPKTIAGTFWNSDDFYRNMNPSGITDQDIRDILQSYRTTSIEF